MAIIEKADSFSDVLPAREGQVKNILGAVKDLHPHEEVTIDAMTIMALIKRIQMDGANA